MICFVLLVHYDVTMNKHLQIVVIQCKKPDVGMLEFNNHQEKKNMPKLSKDK